MRLLLGFAASVLCVSAVLLAGNRTETKTRDAARAVIAEPSDEFVVHEWGTFTSFSGSDGIKLEFRPLVENDLPRFVLDRARQSGIPNPWAKLDILALQRMETPVTYFYTDREREVHVRVGFPKGLLTEFYPPVESMKPEFKWGKKEELTDSELDWGKIWLIPSDRFQVDVGNEELGAQLRKMIIKKLLPQAAVENHYEYAREIDSAFVYLQRTRDKKRPVLPAGDFLEKFLFYRGVGNFRLSLRLESQGGDRFVLANDGADAIRSLFLVTVDGEQLRFSKYDQIEPGQRLSMYQSQQTSTINDLTETVVEALVAENLYEKEARAMVKTWKSSWFGEQGTRLFYMLPERITEELLPLDVKPRPSEVVRVLVGRMEIMTPEEESRITNLVRNSAKSRAATQAANSKNTKKNAANEAAANNPFHTALKKMGRLAEPALVRVKHIADDVTVRNEASTLLQELLAARRT